jgi:transcriptional regulator with XRE-family HTH domain
MKTLAQFVKYKRKSRNLTQEEFTLMAGVVITLVRKIEQGK